MRAAAMPRASMAISPGPETSPRTSASRSRIFRPRVPTLPPPVALRLRRALALLDPALTALAPRLTRTATVAQLNALIAVTECESFSAAARRLNVAQPTVHRAISQLEGEVGQPLFDRTSHG
eukprot:gene48007-64415_t